MREPETIHANEDTQLIPAWSMATAALAFVLVEYYFWFVFPLQTRHTSPIGLRTYLNLSWGLLAAVYFLMIGYISKDAPRRQMSTRFWMVTCFVMPGGIGAVLYFLLRTPLVARCAACGTLVLDEFHFCPQCNYQLSASCGQCFSTVRTTDMFCTRCGHELERDHMPARLRAVPR